MSRLNILITGLSLGASGNRGSTLILKGMYKSLKYWIPNADITLESFYEEDVKFKSEFEDRYGIKLKVVRKSRRIKDLIYVHLGLRNKLPRYVLESDVVIENTGVSYSDYRTFYQNLGLYLKHIVFIKAGKPLIFFTQAMGPFRRRSTKLLARKTLSKASLIIARGVITKKYLEDLGLRDIKLCADAAFLLDPSVTTARSVLQKLGLNSSKRTEYVIFSPNSIIITTFRKHIYKDLLKEYLRIIANNTDMNIIMLPYFILRNRYDDLKLSREILNSLPSRFRDRISIIDPRGLSDEELISLPTICSAAICSRFESCVAALNAGIAPLTIGWGHKYVELLMMFNIENYVIDTLGQDISITVSRELLLRYLNELERLHNRVRSNLRNVKELALKAGYFVREIVT